MPPGDYGFSTRFGWLNDRFGVSWQLICGERSVAPVPFPAAAALGARLLTPAAEFAQDTPAGTRRGAPERFVTAGNALFLCARSGGFGAAWHISCQRFPLLRGYLGGVSPLLVAGDSFFAGEQPMRRTLSICLAVLATALFVSARAQASEDSQTHEGKVVSVTGHKLIMTMKGETAEHTHMIPNDAKITLDGKPATAEDLKAGMRIKVTTPKGNLKLATKIEAFSKTFTAK